MADVFKTIKIGIETKEEDVKETRTKFEQLVDGFTSYFKKSFSDKKTWKDIGQNLASSLMSGLETVVQWFKTQFKIAWAELGQIVDQSFLTNQKTRTNAFTYGLNQAESYGFEQAKSMLGIQSDEDLMYMNEYQGEKFRELMSKYTEKYNQLYDSGFFEQYLDYEIEMKELQQDLKLEFVQFFMDNKDVIKEGMLAIMDLSKFAIQALGKILSFFGIGSSNYSDSIVNNSNTITNNNIKVDNTINNNGQNQDNLLNPGLLTYEQVMSILKA